MPQPVILHDYFRSSTSFRIRAALNLKGVEYEGISYQLLKEEHRSAQYLALNPQGLMPTLQWSDGTIVNQSLAILEYLEEQCGEPALLPKTARERARVRALAQMVGCDIHPLNNLRVLMKLRHDFGADDAGIKSWFTHWVVESFGPMEAMLATSPDTGIFCHGDDVSIADLCLVAQVANNTRFDVDMTPYPTISRIYDACMGVDAISRAAPWNHPDAPPA